MKGLSVFLCLVNMVLDGALAYAYYKEGSEWQGWCVACLAWTCATLHALSAYPAERRADQLFNP